MVEIKAETKPSEETSIDKEIAERWIGIYIRDYKGELPSETYEKSTRCKLEIPRKEEMMIIELGAILRIRPKFLSRVGATPGQIEWLKKRVR